MVRYCPVGLMPQIRRGSTFPFKIFTLHTQHFSPQCIHFSRCRSSVHAAIIAVVAAAFKDLREVIHPESCSIFSFPLFVLGGLVIFWTTYSLAPMSSNPPDVTAYHLAYKSAVYENLFSGIVYGKQPLACSLFFLVALVL